MTTRLYTIALLALLLITGCHRSGQTLEPHVLVIGIDGTRWDALMAADTPNLDKLLQHGAYANNTRLMPGPERPTGADTVSGPGWSAIITGTFADKHMVIDNEFRPHRYDRYPSFLTRLKQARPKLDVASFTDWSPLASHVLADLQTSYDFPPVEEEPEHGYRIADARVARAAEKYLREEQADALFVYLGNNDEAGHAKGFHPSVGEYMRAIERTDRHIGRLLLAIHSRPNFAKENWLLLMTTDHGGFGTGHGDGHGNPEVNISFIVIAGADAPRGEITRPTSLVDVPATAIVHMGVAIEKDWELDGTPLIRSWVLPPPGASAQRESVATGGAGARPM